MWDFPSLIECGIIFLCGTYLPLSNVVSFSYVGLTSPYRMWYHFPMWDLPPLIECGIIFLYMWDLPPLIECGIIFLCGTYLPLSFSYVGLTFPYRVWYHFPMWDLPPLIECGIIFLCGTYLPLSSVVSFSGYILGDFVRTYIAPSFISTFQSCRDDIPSKLVCVISVCLLSY